MRASLKLNWANLKFDEGQFVHHGKRPFEESLFDLPLEGVLGMKVQGEARFIAAPTPGLNQGLGVLLEDVFPGCL